MMGAMANPKDQSQPFLTDIKTLRDRARQHIERGAVTESYRGDQDGKHGFQATGDDCSRGVEVLDSREVEAVRNQHGDDGKGQQESPLLSRVVSSGDLPGRIHDEPPDARAHHGIDKDTPSIILLYQVSGEDICKGK